MNCIAIVATSEHYSTRPTYNATMLYYDSTSDYDAVHYSMLYSIFLMISGTAQHTYGYSPVT